MKTLLITFGSKILSDLFGFLKSNLGKITIFTAFFYIGINLIPFNFELDSEILNALNSDITKTFFYNLSFMLPISFIFKCILISFLSRYISSFLGLIYKIFEYIFNIFKGDSNAN